MLDVYLFYNDHFKDIYCTLWSLENTQIRLYAIADFIILYKYAYICIVYSVILINQFVFLIDLFSTNELNKQINWSFM